MISMDTSHEPGLILRPFKSRSKNFINERAWWLCDVGCRKKEISFEIIAQFLSPWHEMVKITERTSFRKTLALKRKNQHLDDHLTFVLAAEVVIV